MRDRTDAERTIPSGASTSPGARKVLLITGATGFVGSHFLYRWLKRSTSTAHVVAVARGESHLAARERVVAALADCAASYLETPLEDLSRLKVVRGDLVLPFCGIDESVLQELAPMEVEIWHMAASLQFEEKNRASIFEHNLTGTLNLLAAAEQIGARRFVYVSTAYTAGARRGVIAEELHPVEGPFNNPYEESKCLAEYEVVRACAARGMDAQILRPSIVVGPQTTLKPGGTKSGFYGFFRELYRLRKMLSEIDRPLVIEGDGTMPLNIVPVDHVVEDMLELSEHDFADGPIHHLTSREPPSVDAQLEVACRFAGVPRIRMGARTEPPIPIERLLDRRIEFYNAYLKNEKRFARHLSPRRQVTLSDVGGYFAEFQRELKRADSVSIFETRIVAGVDGTPMRTFSAGDAKLPAVVFVNAYGMAADFFVPLARALSPHFRVITWELRGLPNTGVPFAPDASSVEDYARDLELVLEAYGVERAHFIGWCSGVLLLLRFVSLFENRALSLALLNGTLGGSDGAPLSDFEKKVFQIIPYCARGPKYARLFCDVVFGNQRADPANAAEEERVNGILDHIDPGLVHMTSAPFRTPEALYRYAYMIDRLRSVPAQEWAAEVDVPALVVGGSKDLIVNPDASPFIAARLEGSRLVMRPEEDHFLLYHDETLGPLLESFFKEHEPASRVHRPDVRELVSRDSSTSVGGP